MKLTVEYEDVKVAKGIVIEASYAEAFEIGRALHRHFSRKGGRRNAAQSSVQELGANLNQIKFGSEK